MNPSTPSTIPRFNSYGRGLLGENKDTAVRVGAAGSQKEIYER